MSLRRSIVGVAMAVVACGCAPDGADPAASRDISNTGYVGTWVRGKGYVRSELAIVKDGEAYRVRWNLRSEGGERSVDCDWDGACKETVNDELVAEFRLSPSVHPDSGNLWIECRGESYKPETKQIYFKDELVLRPKGRRFVAHTIEEGSATFVRGEGQPRRIFDKESDSVTNPPAAVGG